MLLVKFELNPELKAGGLCYRKESPTPWGVLSAHLCAGESCKARGNAGEQLKTSVSVRLRNNLKEASYSTDLVVIPGAISCSLVYSKELVLE